MYRNRSLFSSDLFEEFASHSSFCMIFSLKIISSSKNLDKTIRVRKLSLFTPIAVLLSKN